MESMTAERLQQEIDNMTDRKFIMIYGRIDQDSKFPDFWKIDHTLQHYYTVSGPDFLVFGEKLTVQQTASGQFIMRITVGEGDLVANCYLKNVYQINVCGPEESA